MKFNFEFDDAESKKMGVLLICIGNVLTTEASVKITGDNMGKTTAAVLKMNEAVKTTEKSKGKPAPTPEPEDVPEEITIDMLREKVTELTQASKGSKIKALLTKLGINKVSELPEENYAEFYAQLQKL